MRSRELDAARDAVATLDDVPDGVHPWFRAELERARRRSSLDDLVADDWLG